MSDACVLCDHNVPRADGFTVRERPSLDKAWYPDDGVMCRDTKACVDRAIQRIIRGEHERTPWQRELTRVVGDHLRASLELAK